MDKGKQLLYMALILHVQELISQLFLKYFYRTFFVIQKTEILASFGEEGRGRNRGGTQSPHPTLSYVATVNFSLDLS